MYLQEALHIRGQQTQELMALRRVFLPQMGQLLRDRQRISRALQDSQARCLYFCCRVTGAVLVILLRNSRFTYAACTVTVMVMFTVVVMVIAVVMVLMGSASVGHCRPLSYFTI